MSRRMKIQRRPVGPIRKVRVPHGTIVAHQLAQSIVADLKPEIVVENHRQAHEEQAIENGRWFGHVVAAVLLWAVLSGCVAVALYEVLK